MDFFLKLGTASLLSIKNGNLLTGWRCFGGLEGALSLASLAPNSVLVYFDVYYFLTAIICGPSSFFSYFLASTFFS